MNASEAYHDLSESIRTIYDKREAENIADWVIENITTKKRWQRSIDKTSLTIEELTLYDQYKAELLTGKPVQYVLNEAFFCGFRFILNENVLIPRPETEELVQLIVDENREKKSISILDIGTGSGCIPVSLKKKLPETSILSIDISEEAIKTARENARNLGADIHFRTVDFLNEEVWSQFHQYDIIVSNPPYIPFSEKETLNRNVVDFEPEKALFVPQNDPFIFYRKIGQFSRTHLKPEGKGYLEVHEKYAQKVLHIFKQNGYHGRIVKDIYGKDRMVVFE